VAEIVAIRRRPDPPQQFVGPEDPVEDLTNDGLLAQV
jgi:hypothetical protein